MTAMKRITLFAFALMLAIACRAQQNQPKDTPQLEFALQLRVTLAVFIVFYRLGICPKRRPSPHHREVFVRILFFLF